MPFGSFSSALRRRALPLASLAAASSAWALGGSSSCDPIKEEGAAAQDTLGRWQTSWERPVQGWHRAGPNERLIQNYKAWVEGLPGIVTDRRTLVPLCGATIDMFLLRALGHEVVGVEGIPKAIAKFRDEFMPAMAPATVNGVTVHREPAERDEGGEGGAEGSEGGRSSNTSSSSADTSTDASTATATDESGPAPLGGGAYAVSIVEGDLFEVTNPNVMGTFDTVWDRGSMVAIQPALRQRYAKAIGDVLNPGGRVLLVALDYDQVRSKHENTRCTVVRL